MASTQPAPNGVSADAPAERRDGFSSNGRDGTRPDALIDAPLLELVGRIVSDVSGIVDKQIELAKQEVREDIGEVVGALKRLAIGAGIAAGAGLLLVVSLWVAVLFWLSWAGAWLLGRVGLDWLGGMLGWLLGMLLPAAIALFAWKKFIRPAFGQVKIKPLERTRATLKEDLEWVQRLRTPSAK